MRDAVFHFLHVNLSFLFYILSIAFISFNNVDFILLQILIYDVTETMIVTNVIAIDAIINIPYFMKIASNTVTTIMTSEGAMILAKCSVGFDGILEGFAIVISLLVHGK